jgi:hypothetical protein
MMYDIELWGFAIAASIPLLLSLVQWAEEKTW